VSAVQDEAALLDLDRILYAVLANVLAEFLPLRAAHLRDAACLRVEV
jgi:hypothetical protein